MYKNIVLITILSLFMVGCDDAKVEPKTTLSSPVKQAQEKPMILQATPYLQIVKEIGVNPMLIEFGSTSCASCVEMGKLLYRAKQAYPQSAIYFIEVYADTQATRDYKIQMIPTQIYLNAKGAESDRHIGMINYEQLIAKLKIEKVIKE